MCDDVTSRSWSQTIAFESQRHFFSPPPSMSLTARRDLCIFKIHTKLSHACKHASLEHRLCMASAFSANELSTNDIRYGLQPGRYSAKIIEAKNGGETNRKYARTRAKTLTGSFCISINKILRACLSCPRTLRSSPLNNHD